MTNKSMAKRKTNFNCGQCGASGATPNIPCGWCKEQTGNKTTHILCDNCFMRGCSVMNPAPKLIKEEKEYEEDYIPGD